MEIFAYDNASGEMVINQYEILLVKEFGDLWDKTRNITKEDPTGMARIRTYKELKYIYLMIDWKSPYQDYVEQLRHTECLRDSGLTELEFDDAIFRAACNKYKEIQESSRIARLLKAAYNKLDDITIHITNVDLEERDPLTGKPIFKAKEVMDTMANLGKTIEGIKVLEQLYKKEQEADKKLRADATPGAFD